MDVVKANGFDVEEHPQGGLQLTAVPISKNTTFGVRPACLGLASLQACILRTSARTAAS